MPNDKSLFEHLSALLTEQRNERTVNIDSFDVESILRAINREDTKTIGAVKREIPFITNAIRIIVRALQSGGRLIYVGAGTSGRLGILDAAECPPTYGTNPSLVQGIIAGGRTAVFKSKEGAEDRQSDGARDVRLKSVGSNDVVCGIAASMRTPYVFGAMKEAKRRGAQTILVTTNPRSMLKKTAFTELRKCVDVAICPEVGPEVIMGSTRMKAGTAQKLVLNMLTTTAMIRLGKVYGNMMVDLKMNSRKLEERAKRVIMIATGVDYKTASRELIEANGHVKTAIVMIKSNISAAQARRRLRKAKGFVRLAINNRSSRS
ncbi:MAG: N-acetylmuramic acid 6-phosphate etherase [Ignavibacteria bacterium]|nr:N-acetylmuramic acid 6-phosphate etherase [Ignavibacteria bacterium]MBI3765562.1 N-acetylmuramic acid 6-phosphate etherase [Ignavibacteriales bacterium]